jgi:hypothetical protein
MDDETGFDSHQRVRITSLSIVSRPALDKYFVGKGNEGKEDT